VHANQFKYVTLIDNVLTKQWHLDKALDVARVRLDYEKSLLKQIKVVEVCFCALSSWLQEDVLSWLPSIVFDRLYCSVLSTHGVVPHRHMPSTELILLHDPINAKNGLQTSTTAFR